jgi:3-phenylpropionate/cinnamic acid dioxygenase small subunit
MNDDKRLAELLDRQDIYDALTRFARGMDRFDREAFLSAFHPDAEIAAGPFVGQPEPLWGWARELHDHGQSATQHILLNHSCDLDGDTAHTETYYLFAARNRDDSNWLAGGRYIDRFARRDGAWRIAVRSTVIEWSGLLPTAPIPFGDVPGIALNGVAARDGSDLSYRRPLTNLREPFLP